MWEFFKKYWDLLGGIGSGLCLALLSRFKLESLQIIYSTIILILVCIGLFKILKKELEKRSGKRVKRRDTLIDKLSNKQKGASAIGYASHPTRDGERLGQLMIDIYKRSKKKMEKFKMFLDKFKGYILSTALTILSLVEMFGGYVSQLFGDKVVFNGVNIISLITLLSAIIVAGVSNGFTKEQREKIKTLFSKKNSNELVVQEIKKTLKARHEDLKLANKELVKQEHELEVLEADLLKANNTHQAKVEMFNLVPQLATEEDVQTASNEVVNIEAKIENKKQEIVNTKVDINTLETTINALKSQL